MLKTAIIFSLLTMPLGMQAYSQCINYCKYVDTLLYLSLNEHQSARPEWCDIDSDGDYDLFIGQYDNITKKSYLYKNTGINTTSLFTEMNFNPYKFSYGFTDNTFEFVDMDADGDQDLFLYGYYGTIVEYYKNSGTKYSPNYTYSNLPNGLPSNVSSFAQYPVLKFADLDNDGDQDAVFNDYVYGGVLSTSRIRYYENVGTKNSASFQLVTGSNNPFDQVYQFGYFDFVDIDADNDKDIFASKNDCDSMLFIENKGTASSAGFSISGSSTNPFGNYKFSNLEYHIFPSFVDIDADNDYDAIIGTYSGNMLYFKNTGTSNSAVFQNQNAGINSYNYNFISIVDSLYESNSTSYFAPFLADIDNDADFDLFLGTHDDGIFCYENTGDNKNLNFTLNTNCYTPLTLNSTVKDQQPNLVDIDSDGDLDIFVTNSIDYTYFIENTGTKTSPVFSATNLKVMTDLPYGSNYYRLSFTDLDNDGDYDACLGQKDGKLLYYKNTGSKSSPTFTNQTSSANPFNGIDAGDKSSPVLGDIDYDGDLDLLIAEEEDFKLYENIGSKSSASFSEFPYYKNPFYEQYRWGDDLRSGQLIDLDGNGTLDFIFGSQFDVIFLSAEFFESSIFSGFKTDICPGDSLQLSSSSAADILWSNGEDSNIIYVNTAGNYYAILTSNYGCIDTSETIEIKEPMANLKVSGPATNNYYLGDTLQFKITGQQSGLNYTYKWTPSTNLSSSTVANPYVYGATEITYYVSVMETSSGCEFSDSIELTPKPLSGIEEGKHNTLSFELFPNPAKENFTIQLNEAITPNTQLQIFDALGKLIYSQKIEKYFTTINSSQFNKGLYVLKIVNGKNESLMQKVIIE